MSQTVSAPEAPKLGSSGPLKETIHMLCWCAREASEFHLLSQIGSGTYGDVFLARSGDSTDLVAMKKLKLRHENEGLPITALREIKILTSLRHPHIVELKDVATCARKDPNQRDDVYLVFEYCVADLSGVFYTMQRKKVPWFTEVQLKSYCHQMLEGLAFLHKNRIMHRDMKLSNILLDSECRVKIADFGLSRRNNTVREYTNKVITLCYDYSVDMWSFGCILLELLTGKSPFVANDDLTLMGKIIRACGSPSEEEKGYLSSLPRWKDMERMFLASDRRCGKSYWKDRAKTYVGPEARVSDEALDLVEKLLTYHPLHRWTAEQALQHPWFATLPPLEEIPHLDLGLLAHEYETNGDKRRRLSKPKPGSKG